MTVIETDTNRSAAYSLLPEDLAELQGAVLLLHGSLSVTASVLPATVAGTAPWDRATLARYLTIYVFALARGWYGADDIAARCAEDGCLRYLAGHRPPDPMTLRSFRREESALLGNALARMIGELLGRMDALPRLGFDPATESALRLRRAIEADSLEREF